MPDIYEQPDPLVNEFLDELVDAVGRKMTADMQQQAAQCAMFPELVEKLDRCGMLFAMEGKKIEAEVVASIIRRAKALL